MSAKKAWRMAAVVMKVLAHKLACAAFDMLRHGKASEVTQCFG
ncbi:hypothetical protein OKW43_007757 [Paraburkholderia sp. WC7.3g]